MGQAYDARISTLHDGNIISAALFNNEYNAILNAFSATGHQHDGTAGEGGAIHTIGDSDFLNKIVIESNEIKFFIEVGGGTVEQLNLVDGVLAPETDNDIDLGTSSKNFKTIYAKALDINGAADISGALTGMSSLNVSGTATATGLDINGAADISGALTGMSSVNVSGTATATGLDINGAADISGALTGMSSVNVSGTATATGLDINGAADISGALTGMSSVNVSGTATATGLDINGAADVSGNLTVDTNTLHVDASDNRVAIGNLDPQAPLHIQTGGGGGGSVDSAFTSAVKLYIESNSSSSICLRAGTNSAANFFFGDPADYNVGQIAYSNYNNSMSFFTNGSSKAIIDANGNLSIGNTLPQVKLHVRQTTNGSGANSTQSTSAFFDSSGSNLIGIAAGANAAAGFYFKNSSDSEVGRIFYNHSDNSMTFNTSGTEQLRINSSGYLGLNTTNPLAPIHVSRYSSLSGVTPNSGSSLFIDDQSAALISMGAAWYGSSNLYFGRAAGNGASEDNDSGSIYYSNYFSSLNFKVNGSDRMHINYAGNLGVGTSVPTEKVDINSDKIRLRNSNTPSSASSTGAKGEICYDTNYVYVCVATNTWKRAALATW